MSRYAYDKKFGPFLSGSPSLIAQQLTGGGGVAGVPIFSLASGATAASAVAIGSGRGNKKTAQLSTRDRSNWRLDAPGGSLAPETTRRASIDESGRSSTPTRSSTPLSSSPPTSSHIPATAAESTSGVESTARGGEAGRERRGSGSGSGSGRERGKKGKGKKGGSRGRSDSIGGGDAKKESEPRDELPPTRRPLQLLQRKEIMKSAVGVWRYAAGPEADPTARGFAGRGRGKALPTEVNGQRRDSLGRSPPIAT